MAAGGTSQPTFLLAQGHDLPAGDAHVAAIIVLDVVAPAAAFLTADALGLEDELHGTLERRPHLLAEFAIRHAGRLGEHQGADAVVVHAVALVSAEQAVGVLLLDDPADALFDDFAVLALSRNMAGGEERHHGQCRGRGAFLGLKPPGTVALVLSRGEVFERFLDGFVRGRIAVLYLLGVRGQRGEKCQGNQQTTHDMTPANETPLRN